jgi:hypothetical protein
MAATSAAMTTGNQVSKKKNIAMKVGVIGVGDMGLGS